MLANVNSRLAHGCYGNKSYLKKTFWSSLSARNRRLGLNTAKSTTYFRPRLRNQQMLSVGNGGNGMFTVMRHGVKGTDPHLCHSHNIHHVYVIYSFLLYIYNC